MSEELPNESTARKRKVSSKGKVTPLSLDSYESWLANQAATPEKSKPEGRLPADTFQEWMRKRVAKEIRKNKK